MFSIYRRFFISMLISIALLSQQILYATPCSVDRANALVYESITAFESLDRDNPYRGIYRDYSFIIKDIEGTSAMVNHLDKAIYMDTAFFNFLETEEQFLFVVLHEIVHTYQRQLYQNNRVDFSFQGMKESIAHNDPRCSTDSVYAAEYISDMIAATIIHMYFHRPTSSIKRLYVKMKPMCMDTDKYPTWDNRYRLMLMLLDGLERKS